MTLSTDDSRRGLKALESSCWRAPRCGPPEGAVWANRSAGALPEQLGRTGALLGRARARRAEPRDARCVDVVEPHVRAASRWVAARGDSRATVHGDDPGTAHDDLAGGHLPGRPAVTPFLGLWSVEVPGGRVGPQDRLIRWLAPALPCPAQPAVLLPPRGTRRRSPRAGGPRTVGRQRLALMTAGRLLLDPITRSWTTASRSRGEALKVGCDCVG